MSPRRPALFPSAFAPHLGGVEELTRQLALEQQSRGLAPLIVTMLCPPTLPREDVVDGLPVRRLPFRLPGANPRASLPWLRHEASTRRALLDALRAHEADLIHVECVSNNAPYALYAAEKLKLPLVVSMQGELTMDAGRVYQRSAAQRRAWRRLVDRADRVTACSQYVLSEAETFRGREFGDRGHVVRNGIALDDFADPAPRKHGRDYVLGLGRLVPQKGLDLLIDAFARIAQQFPEVDLVIAGHGPERDRLEEQARSNGIGDRTVFLGGIPHDEAVRVFAGASVFVMPSRHEPQGIVTLEAAAAQTPVIAAKVGGVPELIEDEHNGLLFKGEDVAGLATALTRVLGSPETAQQMVSAGTEVLRSVTWPRITDEYLALYDEAEASATSRRHRSSGVGAPTSTHS